jgi:hypothetical protein
MRPGRPPRVVAHLQVERVSSAAVCPRLEEQRVSLRAHLIVDLLVGNLVDLRLDLTRRHARIEDDHVRAEVRLAGRAERTGGRGANSHGQDGGGDGDSQEITRRPNRPRTAGKEQERASSRGMSTPVLETECREYWTAAHPRSALRRGRFAGTIPATDCP